FAEHRWGRKCPHCRKSIFTNDAADVDSKDGGKEAPTDKARAPSINGLRLDEINHRLAALNRMPPREANSCPACAQGKLHRITGDVTGRCPLCNLADLAPKHFESDHCPVCRSGKLARDKRLCCPICRKALVHQEEKRTWLVFKTAWYVCPISK